MRGMRGNEGFEGGMLDMWGIRGMKGSCWELLRS